MNEDQITFSQQDKEEQMYDLLNLFHKLGTSGSNIENYANEIEKILRKNDYIKLSTNESFNNNINLLRMAIHRIKANENRLNDFLEIYIQDKSI